MDAISGGSIVAVRNGDDTEVSVSFVANVYIEGSTFTVSVDTGEIDLDNYDSDSADGTPTMSGGGR